MIKIVFFDVDGTLMHDKQIPDTTREAIALLQANGIRPVIATGRSEYEMQAVREALGIEWALTCNGAHLGHKGATVSGTAFAPETIRAWMEHAAATPHHTLLLYGAEQMFMTRPTCPYFEQARDEIGFRDPVWISDPTLVPPIYQVILFAPEEETTPYLAGHADELYIHRWRTWAVDFNPANINKAVGVQQVLDRFGHTVAEAAAFGDGKNDIEMLQLVGTGVAMGNSCAELLACARHVTKHAGEDGILHGVKTLIL